MTKEQHYFLQIMHDYAYEIKTENIVNIDWKVIYDCSQLHQLTAITYAQCKTFLTVDFEEKFRCGYFATVSAHVRRKTLTDSILMKLSEQGIKSFLIKGAVVANFYPNCQLRTMGDVDIVVDNLGEAHKVMQNQGFEVKTTNQGREWQYQKNGIEIELHDRIIFDEAINDARIVDFMNDYKPYVIGNTMDSSFHFIYIISHLRKHLMNRGVGFRQFLDVAMMAKNCTDLDWGWIKDSIEKIGLLQFTKTVFAFIYRWWNIKFPIEYAEIEEDFYISGTEFIFKNGVFGFNNEDNADYLSANEVRNRKYRKTAMISRMVEYIFPSYSTMCDMQPYSFLKKYPYLLPLAWVYRFCRGIKHGSTKTISQSFVSSKYIDKRERMFEQWGLL